MRSDVLWEDWGLRLPEEETDWVSRRLFMPWLIMS